MKNRSSVTGSTSRNSPLSDWGPTNEALQAAMTATQDSPHDAINQPLRTMERETQRPLRPALERQYREILKASDLESINARYSAMGEDVRLAVGQRTTMLESAMRLSDRDPVNAAKSFDAAAEATRVVSADPGRLASERQLLSGERQAIMALAATMRAKTAADPRHQRKFIDEAKNRGKMLSTTVKHPPTPIVTLATKVARALEVPSRGETQTAMPGEVLARRDVFFPENVMTFNEKVEKYLEGLVLPAGFQANARPSTSSAASRPPEARGPRITYGHRSFAK
jgi:hypothetical protein